MNKKKETRKIWIASAIMLGFIVLCVLFQDVAFGLVAGFLTVMGKLLNIGYAWSNYVFYVCLIPAGWIFMCFNRKNSLSLLPASLMYFAATVLIGILFVDIHKFLNDGTAFCTKTPAPFPFINTTSGLHQKMLKYDKLMSDSYIASGVWLCVILPALPYYLLYILNKALNIIKGDKVNSIQK